MKPVRALKAAVVVAVEVAVVTVAAAVVAAEDATTGRPRFSHLTAKRSFKTVRGSTQIDPLFYWLKKTGIIYFRLPLTEPPLSHTLAGNPKARRLP